MCICFRNKDLLLRILPSKWVSSDYKKKRIVNLLNCVYETHTDELCSAVVDHFNGEIDLSWCEETADQISCAMGHLLKQCRGSLKVVNLLGCNIGDKGCEIVINSLLSHRNNYSSMFELNLDSNAITKNSSPLIALLISSNYPITKLDLGYNPLCSVVYESLYQNNTLTKLTLRDTSLTSSDLQSLGQMLASNNTLSVLDISFNDISS